MPMGRDGKSEIAERLRETAEDLMELVAAQVKLIRLELHEDVRNLGTRVARVAVFLPLVLLGYGFVAGAGTYALGTVIGVPWALLSVGAVHLALGAWGMYRATRSLREIKVLDRSREELERT